MIKKKRIVPKVKKKKKKKSKMIKLRLPKREIFVIMLLLMSIVFSSSALILFIGLLPLFVAFFVDRSKKKTRVITVGAMNIAGCTPFLMKLWMGGGAIEQAVSIIFDPMAIIVIYSAAGAGYVIDWGMTLLVASILYQRGIARKKAIEKRQEELIQRWGKEVTGKMALDPDGFPTQ